MAGVIPAIDIRRGDDRFRTKISWLDSYHSFSFSRHYDPQNTHFGLLLVSNDDVIAAESGFQTHPHQDMEIVTWVIRGEIEHQDSEGNSGVIYPGLAQRMSAGSGIWHSEMNASKGGDVHLVQMWVVPDTPSIAPSCQQLDIGSEVAKGGLVPVASGRGHESAIAIRQEGATLWRGSSPQASRRRCPPHRSPTSTWPKATSNSRVAASSSAATPPASPTNPAYG